MTDGLWDALRVGDDITVDGKIAAIHRDVGVIVMITQNGTDLWVTADDVKTHRPNQRKENAL